MKDVAWHPFTLHLALLMGSVYKAAASLVTYSPPSLPYSIARLPAEQFVVKAPQQARRLPLRNT